jgi:DNA modification methylase
LRGPSVGSFPEWYFSGAIGHTVVEISSTQLEEPPDSVQLVLTSPPDLHESEFTNWPELFNMYEIVFGRCLRALKVRGVICVIITDRKWKGRIVRKHEAVAAIADRLGLSLFAHKILVRTQQVDLYRLTFSHVLCFRRQTERHTASSASASNAKQFRKDLWGPFDRAVLPVQNRNSFAPEAVQLLVEAFSQLGSVVLDPFCGAGTTQRVALGLGRKAIGYEVDPKMRSCWKPLSIEG